MRISDLLENRQSPLSAETDDDIRFGMQEAATLMTKAQNLPGKALTRPLTDQLHAIIKQYKAELERRSRIRASR